MAKFIVTEETGPLEKLEGALHTTVVREMLEAGAKVVEKEYQGSIVSAGHVLTGAMRDSVAAGRIFDDIGGSSIEILPQGDDGNGVSNELKNTVINKGCYYKASGGRRKKDPYMKKLRSRVEPRVKSVMGYQMEISLRRLGVIN